MKARSLMARLRGSVLLLVFLSPIVIYWIYCLIIRPAPHYAAIDPEYEYFLNSLATFKHQPYTYVDHPGTPVEMIGTAILAATYPWLAHSPGGFIRFQLQNPQLFLTIAYVLLALLHLACIVIFFRVGLRSGALNAALLSAALATMYFAIQPYAFSGSLTWSHNSLSFPFGTILLLWLYSSITAQRRGQDIPAATWIGLGLGVGILAATTIFLAAWVVGVLTTIVLYYWLGNLRWRNMVLAIMGFGLSALSGFYLAVLPVINRMGGFWRWIYSILSHQSNYLAVPTDQSTLARLPANTASLLQLLPALFAAIVISILLALGALALWRGRIREQFGLWAVTAGLGAQMLALTLVFLDRPLRAYYFLGVAAILPVFAMAVFTLYERSPSAHQFLAGAVSLAVLVGLVMNSIQGTNQQRDQAQTIAASEKLVQQVVANRAAATNRSPDKLTVLWMYGSYSQCWGLWFANQRAGGAFDPEIAGLCPNQYELTGRVQLPNGRAPLQETNWDIIFTCDRYTDNVLPDAPAAQVRHYPSIEWACGKVAVILNR